ncbi:hypothetical protein BT69DRAFT_1365076 [Atractiella rhizophila]|nr:hypothetical protein BT69DRAFT_1365076 [Atractiella rhizophila]
MPRVTQDWRLFSDRAGHFKSTQNTKNLGTVRYLALFDSVRKMQKFSRLYLPHIPKMHRLEQAVGEEVLGMINLVPGVVERDWILDKILSSGMEAGLVKSGGLEGFSELSREEVQQKAKGRLAASQRCLVLGKYLEQSRIRTIQTIILFCRNLKTTSIPTYTATFALSLLGTAIRISQLLTLHRLGEDENLRSFSHCSSIKLDVTSRKCHLTILLFQGEGTR